MDKTSREFRTWAKETAGAGREVPLADMKRYWQHGKDALAREERKFAQGKRKKPIASTKKGKSDYVAAVAARCAQGTGFKKHKKAGKFRKEQKRKEKAKLTKTQKRKSVKEYFETRVDAILEGTELA